MPPEIGEDVTLHVARRIAELRERQGLTQEKIAEAIGSALTNYRRIESGRQNLTLRTIAKIARALGVSTWELLVKSQQLHPKRGPGRPRKRIAP